MAVGGFVQWLERSSFGGYFPNIPYSQLKGHDQAVISCDGYEGAVLGVFEIPLLISYGG